ncbi:cobalamin biosynthesis protein CbiB [Shewanella sp. Choline-02u-19]|uniref:cobalamin biosynthesis protein CobD/CbiB n=1 Tax=unclassified Shewanella TaxID=196818 RepID=UPI000C326219|nr:MULTISPECIES: cobalamin biosynthesis protein [unclassified Shewanella]PKH57622.1 cobalamin biosynthesis protein CbiB [Shewanella sp. Bg11-22]PKI28484.1 cobalamin biosynthesis protein CbiB [Shewanella sp. Choline-02u-19]
MVPEFTKFFSQDGQLYIGAIVLLMSILIARMAPLPRQLQPLEWLTNLAKSLSLKVNHTHRAASQQFIAGMLATLLLILPFWFIISFFAELAEFPWFVEALIIYVCLQDDHFRYIANEVSMSIRRDNKARARTLLLPWLNRSTQSLSSVGLSKVTIERLATTPTYGVAATVLFYCVGGVPLLLIARMVKQLDNAWPVYNPQYRYFGTPVYALSAVIHFIPAKLWSFTLAIQGGPRSLATLFNPSINATPIIEYQTHAVIASALNIELGGPAKFPAGKNAETKVSMPKLKYGPLPTGGDIQRALKLNSIAFGLWTVSIILLPVIWGTLRIWQG